jgi:hypothetical protein
MREILWTIDRKLRPMEKLLPNHKLTLVARYQGTDLTDADIVLSNDDLDKVIAAIEQLKERDPLIWPVEHLVETE